MGAHGKRGTGAWFNPRIFAGDNCGVAGVGLAKAGEPPAPVRTRGRRAGFPQKFAELESTETQGISPGSQNASCGVGL